ncbi:uncharacterized protein F4812DRAFT_232093 [Daldinia caldariorum]|uniref:uncharacterized protein n=1 Tax=Daldinia caldariorum TaxID=326644 RepID=UPI00200780A8|nr:uncharacterized protein F4812DRAFT_232093 [Daldinia caldariorum]KAI1463810.1 hypothetical protein F4812DRAFT_232093 [Daldinia caldariorum]
MASKATPTKEAYPQFSAREMEVLAIAWQCFEVAPKINWDKLAKLAPFKNVSTARSCFAPIKKKLALASGEITAAQTSEPSTPTKRGGKRKASVEKTPRSGKKAKTASKALSSFEEDDEEEANAKIKAAIKADIEAQEKKEKEEDDANDLV